ncbi:MAG: PepSY domain-containing protein [Halioglobus sp.]|nr:PepSY domain-containing protein [Halioglobus sp.]
MKASTLKTFLDVHTWTGLCSGLALFIAFYAGALTVFWLELDAWASALDVPQMHQDYEQAQQLFDMTLEVAPGAADRVRLYLSRPGQEGHRMRWFEQVDDETFESHEFRLDQGGGVYSQHEGSQLADFIYRLHFTAGLPSSFGLYVLGIICVIYGLALVTGVVIFLPNFFRDLFVVRTGDNKKRFWLDTHNVVGLLSLPWHIMFAWSSALLAIGVFVMVPFQYLVYEKDMESLIGSDLGVVEHPEPTGEQAPVLPVKDLIGVARSEVPGLEPEQIRYEYVGDTNAVVTVRGKTASGTLSPFASVTMNASTGRVVDVRDPAEATVGATFYTGLISLHYATFGGYVTRWLYFLLGLAGAFLFYSGNLLWIESRRRRRSPEQTRGAVFLARLNTGVCIGCMAGISAAFVASRVLSGMVDRVDVSAYAYFAVFFLSIGWSYLRPVATATRDLLYLAALLSAAIPLLDVMMVDVLPWNEVGSIHWPVVTIDALALLAAVAFWRMGVAVQQRAMRGDLNSVWAGDQLGSKTSGAAVGLKLQSTRGRE